MADMVDLMEGLRAAEADPVLLRIYEQAAADIVTQTLEDDRYLWDPAYNEMTGDEREAFLNDVAIGLALALLRATICWNLFDATPASEWLGRRRAGA